MGLKICGILSIETVDKDGDLFKIDGMSIDACQNKKGFLNWDHEKTASGLIGIFTDVRKLFKLEDCKTEQEKRLYKLNNQIPCLYGVAELFNDSNHLEANSVSQIIQACKNSNLPLNLYFSIEVEPVSVTTNKIYTLSVLKRAALTIKPVNLACHCEVLEETSYPVDNAKDQTMNIKNPKEEVKTSSLMKEVEMTKSELDEKLTKVIENLTERASEISKALEAGYNVASAGTAVQGAALQKSKNKGMHVATIPEETTDEPHEESSPVFHIPQKDADALKKDSQDPKVMKRIKEMAELFVKNVKIAKKV